MQIGVFMNPALALQMACYYVQFDPELVSEFLKELQSGSASLVGAEIDLESELEKDVATLVQSFNTTGLPMAALSLPDSLVDALRLDRRRCNILDTPDGNFVLLSHDGSETSMDEFFELFDAIGLLVIEQIMDCPSAMESH